MERSFSRHRGLCSGVKLPFPGSLGGGLCLFLLFSLYPLDLLQDSPGLPGKGAASGGHTEWSGEEVAASQLGGMHACPAVQGEGKPDLCFQI